MKHARADYQRFQDPAGKIPDDEPVILFRAQDVFFPALCRFYADLCEKNGLTEMARVTRGQADAGEAWPIHKLPDMPTDMVAEINSLNDRMPTVELKITNLTPEPDPIDQLGRERRVIDPSGSFTEQMLKKG